MKFQYQSLTTYSDLFHHYSNVAVGGMASQITSLTIVYSTVYSGVDRRKHQSSASLAYVLGIHRWPVNSPHKWPVTRKRFPFDDVSMIHDYNGCCVMHRCLGSEYHCFQTWEDPSLAWNPSHYTTYFTRLKASDIWTPFMGVLNGYGVC